MKSLDDIPINDAIQLYYEKNHAMRNGDVSKLIELKNNFPYIFDKAIENEIREIIDYAKAFQNSPRYKELRRLEVKKSLSLISNKDLDEN